MSSPENSPEVSNAQLSRNKSEDAVPTSSDSYHIEYAKAQLHELDLEALSRNALTWKSKAARRMLLVVIVQGLSVAAFAVDGNVIGGLSALPAFQNYFNVSTSGAAIGIINAALSIGNAVASPFQWLSDLIGRRAVSFLGNAILLLGCVLQTAAPNNACFIMGRVLGGAGASLSATVMPLYVSEVSPARYRGLAVGLACTCYSIGSIVIACTLLGASYIHGNWSWRLPITFQIAPPLLCVILIYLCTPESPRYLISKGKHNQARQVLAKYHTSSESVNDPIVEAEMKQISQSLELIETKPWSFRPLYQKRSGRYRMFIIVLYSFFQQCNGLGLLGYYLPGVLELVGINHAQQQLSINVGMTVAAWLATLAGSTLVDRVRRRVLLMTGLAVFVLFLSLMVIMAGLYANGISQSATGIAMIVFVFAFQICNGLLVSPLHNIYPAEVFHYSQRAKGMGMYSFFQSCFGFAMSYGGSVALNILKWKIYFVYICLNVFALVMTWLFFPEFAHLSLEEIDLVFETPGSSPTRISKQLQKEKAVQRQRELGEKSG